MKQNNQDVRIPFSPEFAALVGVNEALFLQQLHYRLQISKNHNEGHRWVYNTYEEWTHEFPCWKMHVVKRLVKKLETEQLIITSEFNKMPMDRTKWYRIDYEKLSQTCGDFVPFEQTKMVDRVEQKSLSEENILLPAITKELKQTTKNKRYSEKDLATFSSVIEYLNEKAFKRFKHHSKTTMDLLQARIEEGYTVDDFKLVIDTKAAQWLHHPQFRNYLQPSTLFNAEKFENYLNEAPAEMARSIVLEAYTSPTLDFEKGENAYELRIC
ncbi:conserved phage C-terminal domain-containing protein [Sporosarcina sp. P34]|uniref:conserved phage C-terminal domain-containing protein n=1 Tax=Sporosarcina sp. P34 TaxID=2048247 RepID=UPI0013040214|nr:conserved phage C-terminal domain-containing protein [Sporosarcina sp. P34]